jgi:hypothetical protein
MKIVFTLLCVASLALFLLLGPRAQKAQVLQSQLQGSTVVRQTNQDSAVQITEQTRAQLHALLLEKQSRTAAQQKIDSQLLIAARRKRNEPLAPALAQLRIDVAFDTDGRTEIDISGRITENLVAVIVREGGEIINSYPHFNALRARIRPEKLEVIAALDEVRVISRAAQPEVWNVKSTTTRRTRPTFNDRAQSVQKQLLTAFPKVVPSIATPLIPPPAGDITSEGDVTHTANTARSSFSVTGAGIKIGVISDSVRFLADSQVRGELPGVTILSNRSGIDGGDFDSGEGTAMLEIIHDLAPGAQLFFSTGKGSPAAFAQNILDLQAAGCKIIVDDLEYFNESPFYDAVVAQAVNTVTAAGVLYFSSAGNAGNINDLTSSVWEGDFVDGGAITTSEGATLGRALLFSGPSIIFNQAFTRGGSEPVFLFWSDPPGASANDYDLYIVDTSGNIVRRSDDVQNGTQDPIESTHIDNGEHVLVVKFSGANRYLHVNVGRGEFSFATAGRTKGHSATVNAFSVAAVKAGTSFPNAFTGGASNPVETFSSDGPRRIFFNANGTAITPGNFSSTGGTIRAKPDIAAADNVQTSVPGFDPFPGTSAAAPHAAAIAALLLSFNPNLTTTQVRTALTSTALDIEAVGNDRDSGAGIVMGRSALQSIATCPSIPIAAGQTINDALTTSDCVFSGTTRRVDVYQFHGTAGQQVVINLTSAAFDTYLYLLNPNNQIIAEDDDGGDGNNSRIPESGSFTLPVTGTYTIYATSFFNGSTGAYSLNLLSSNCVFSLNPTSQIFISSASAGSFTVSTASTCSWTAASNVSWLTTSASGIGSGTVNFSVAENTGDVRTGTISVAGQTFTVFQSAGNGNGCPSDVITPGQTINATLNTDCVFTGTSRYVDLYNFSGTAGQQIVIVMTSTSFDSYLFLDGPNGQTIAQDDDGAGGLNSRIPANAGSFTLPTTGTYRIFATSFSIDGTTGSTGTYSLSLLNQSTGSSGIQLSASSFSGSEGGNITITVSRTGNTSGSASVNFRTADVAGLQSCTLANGRASERCDYVTALGTVRFAAGESSKTITIPLINDVLIEGNETFTITLSNAVGATLATPAAATVTVIDNDSVAPTVNPIDGVEFFIRQQYLDILNRQPDSIGLQNWINTLAPCPNGGFGEPPTSNCDRLHVAAGFFQSDEFLNRGYWAFRFYMVSQNQRPTYTQFIPDMALVGGPKSPAEEEASKVAFADAFVQRPEFVARYGSLSGQALANALLQTAGLPSSTFTVTGNMTNGRILRGIVETAAVSNRFLTEGTVSIQYFGFLRRDPDTIGYQNNVNTLNASPSNLRHMIFIFIYSIEYRSRFGPP